MNHYVTTFCRMSIAAAALAMCQAQEETSEPIELTRLREQFSNRIEQEMKPWRARYAQELQKLEDRLIKERKLTEVLAVKKEKENYLTVDLGKTADKPVIPATAEKAKEAMIGTVWLVYEGDDKKRENLLNVYHFVDAENVFNLSLKRAVRWKVKSAEQIEILLDDFSVFWEVYFDKAQAETNHLNKKYILVQFKKAR